MQPKAALALTFAVVVVALVMATSASAFEKARVLPTGQLVTWTGEGGKSTLSILSNGGTIECEKSASAGNFEASDPELGAFLIVLEKCKSGIATCTGLGDVSGVILVSGTAHLVVDVLEPPLGAGVLLLISTVHFMCSVELVEESGEVLCLVKPAKTKTRQFEIVCEQTANGDPKETVYWNEAGTKTEMGEGKLLASINHGAGVMAAQVSKEAVLTNSEVTIDS